MSDDAHEDDEAKIGRLVSVLTQLIAKHGSRSEPVRQLIKKNKNLGDFRRLAFTIILLKEGGRPSRDDRRSAAREAQQRDERDDHGGGAQQPD